MCYSPLGFERATQIFRRFASHLWFQPLKKALNIRKCSDKYGIHRLGVERCQNVKQDKQYVTRKSKIRYWNLIRQSKQSYVLQGIFGPHGSNWLDNSDNGATGMLCLLMLSKHFRRFPKLKNVSLKSHKCVIRSPQGFERATEIFLRFASYLWFQPLKKALNIRKCSDKYGVHRFAVERYQNVK